MRYFYHHLTQGFYLEGLHTVPDGTVEISEDTYQSLLNGQANGQQIGVDGQGLPILMPVKPSPYHYWQDGVWQIETVEQLKLNHEMLQRQQQALINKIADKTDRLKAQVLEGYPQAEIDSFYRQEKEALAWKLDNAVPTEMLSAIAKARGVELPLLVEKVLEKANAVSVVMGGIIGTRQGFEDRILSAKILAELTACEQEIEQWQLPNR